MSKHTLTNFHTHTTRCHHATGADAQYVENAIKLGYKALGFSEHTPLKHHLGYHEEPMRMYPEDMDDYVTSINKLQKEYANDINIYIGLEAEYFPQQEAYLKNLVHDYKLDYMIFGNHYNFLENNNFYYGNAQTHEMLRSYTKSAILGMQSGVFDIFAHPDVHFTSYPVFDKVCEESAHEICKNAAEIGIVLEYNLLGRERRLGGRVRGMGYSTDEFWRIAAQYPINCIVGCDAHSPKELERLNEMKQMQEFLESMGINVVDSLPHLNA